MRAGLSSPAVTSRPESVTADRIFLAIASGGSTSEMDGVRPRRRFAHLLSGVVEGHDPGALGGDPGLGSTKVLPKVLLKRVAQVPHQLDVLALVLADRDAVGLVEEDVGRLEHGVGEQARPPRTRSRPSTSP